MNLAELRAKKPEIMDVASKYGVSDIWVFGSLFHLLEFKDRIENILCGKIDLVEVDAVKNPLRKRYMLKDAVPL
ncbi:MAG: hypothetical protein R3D71_09085 [Rickettsiales bacterium]